MALNIKDRETDRLARQLAELTDESITEAVKAALRDRLEREQRRRGKKIDWRMLRQKQAEIARLPVADGRSAEELLDYDESGLPR
ncbi:MAG: type II toxin-antitoxin system VapB family antitoxin [Kiloniellales bacterium]|nr:type II toxin-antitoxin system VapB family antitoxin [Kiloniellales bacterium]